MNKRFSLKALALAVSAAFLFSANANAQATNNGNVTLNLDLRNVVDFVVNTSSTTLVFDTYGKYNAGVTKQEADQFTISSNNPYKVEVKASAANFVGTSGNTQTIPVSDVNVKIYNTTDGGTQSAVDLSSSNQVLSTGATAVLNRKYSIEYFAKGGDNFLVKADIYTTTLTYTATQL
jgi:hypothetical protein